VKLEAMPLTPNGKLDRKALPIPARSAYVSGSYEAPVGELEETLARIWQDLLKVDAVGRGEDFLELGGHSLMAIRMVQRIKRDLGVDIAVRDVFASPQISLLAEHLLIQSLNNIDPEEAAHLIRAAATSA
jgi:hypothetical protein